MKFSKAIKKDIEELSLFIRATTKDIQGVNKDYLKNELKNYTASKMTQDLKNKNNLFIVAKDKNEIIGFVQGIFLGGTCWLEGLGVKKEYQRKGIASKLLEEMELETKQRGGHLLWGNVIKQNTASLVVTKKFGLKKISELKDHFYHLDFILVGKHVKN